MAEPVDWFTTDNGAHVPLMEGETKEEAMNRQFSKPDVNKKLEIDFSDGYDVFRNIPDWFVSKNIEPSQWQLMRNSDDFTVMKETEKAVLLKSEYGGSTWIPKSILKKQSENYNTWLENQIEFYEMKTKPFSNERYDNLVKFAKEKGFNIRAKTRVDTIVRKLKKDDRYGQPEKFPELNDMVEYDQYYKTWKLKK